MVETIPGLDTGSVNGYTAAYTGTTKQFLIQLRIFLRASLMMTYPSCMLRLARHSLAQRQGTLDRISEKVCLLVDRISEKLASRRRVRVMRDQTVPSVRKNSV